ncbi:MAG: glucosidase [Candidatus Eremiobacteraeota bacterium]|nr:glucosidase [Candidatus Eremiobacteraeota bacterium]
MFKRSGAKLERKRLDDDRERVAYWRRWGPYLSERQWGTVREDYSVGGTAWEYLSHDHARSRAYRWGEDGLLGFSDNHQRLCLALALWNGEDPILKERLFGLTGNEGNHGEDVKEYYYYLDGLPSHAYMKALYKYPQRAFPYAQLVEENRRRSRDDAEFELIDTGIFVDNRYFDVFVEYAKDAPDDIYVVYTIINRSAQAAALHVLPTIWFRNTWAWAPGAERPQLSSGTIADGPVIEARHPTLGTGYLYCETGGELLFTENETNFQRLFGVENHAAYVKDGINDFIVSGRRDAVNPASTGTKASAHYTLEFSPLETKTVRLRLCDRGGLIKPFDGFERVLEQRRAETDAFYGELTPFPLSDDMRSIQRQALAGMLWSKQHYSFVVRDWLEGDLLTPPPPQERCSGRNREWTHLYTDDVLSMPDKWEYPWFAAWDLAFHVIPLATIDPDFAKRQLILLTREWFMHPNGQIPAYEWAFGDVNPPVHAWAAYRVFKIEKKLRGEGDYLFLERVFQKLLMNFTWWVNRKDQAGNNVFQGGFLGLDNIGVFDRSATLPTGGHLNQSDGTSWMGVYALNMLAIALELAQRDPSYEDIASKFYEHFLYIADAMNSTEGEREHGLWNEDDGFYYDVLSLPDGEQIPIKVRSMVGLIPLMAVEILEPDVLERLPEFTRRMEWFIKNRPDLRENVACMETEGIGARRLLAIAGPSKLHRILQKMLDESEFFSPHGIRSVSRYHADRPYVLRFDGVEYGIDYEPATSTTGLFGGNSNWRGPIWFPLNFLLVEALQKFHHYFGDEYKVECPTGSGRSLDLWQVATELSHRLMSIFARDERGQRPVFGAHDVFANDEHWQAYVPFHEYFDGDNGAGVGASHQTGWTGVVAKLIGQCAEYCGQSKDPLTHSLGTKRKPVRV